MRKDLNFLIFFFCILNSIEYLKAEGTKEYKTEPEALKKPKKLQLF